LTALRCSKPVFFVLVFLFSGYAIERISPPPAGGSRPEFDVVTGISTGALLATAPLLAQAETPTRQHLFHIERSKNANIIQYDAQVGADGKLFKKEPVVGYWIRLAEQGQEMELSWVQSTFAFGFDTKLERDRESLELEMKLDLGSKISVVRDGDGYRATVPIQGSPSWLEKIYIDADRKGMSANIHYVEVYGSDRETGEARYQKIVP